MGRTRRILAAALFLAAVPFVATPAFAQTEQCTGVGARGFGASGRIALAWDDCGGPSRQDFSCGTSTGAPFTMVASFMLDAPIPDFVGVTLELGIGFTTAVPAWWQFQPGGCRAGALRIGSTDGTSCLDPYEDGPPSSDYVYGPAAHGTSLRVDITRSSAVALSEGADYVAGVVEIRRDLSAGPSACDGCASPACIVLQSVTVHTLTGDVLLRPGSIGEPGWYIGFQADAGMSDCGCSTSKQILCPTIPASWGEVKRRYGAAALPPAD